MNFSEQLKAELDRLNMTQAEGAEALGVSARAVWKWLHGDEPLDITAEGAISRLKRAKKATKKAGFKRTSLLP